MYKKQQKTYFVKIILLCDIHAKKTEVDMKARKIDRLAGILKKLCMRQLTCVIFLVLNELFDSIACEYEYALILICSSFILMSETTKYIKAP